MKSKFELILDPESIERRGRRPAVGAVHVKFGAKAFPAKDWTDFALEFLKAYWEAILKLMTRAESGVCFHEGPFELTFRRTGDEVVVQALDRGEVIHSATLPYTELLEHSMRAILPWIGHEQAVNAG